MNEKGTEKTVLPAYRFQKEYRAENMRIMFCLDVEKTMRIDEILGELASMSHNFYLDFAWDVARRKP